MHGDHPGKDDQDAEAAKVRHAARVSHLTPSAAHAQLLSERLPAAELPSAKQIQRAQRQRSERLEDSSGAFGPGEGWIAEIRLGFRLLAPLKRN